MKSRVSFYAAIGLLILILGTAFAAFSSRDQEPVKVFPATIDRDCAPWDGAAFTVTIPKSNGTVIAVSIYQSPDILFPVTFSFPDETLRIGNALLLPDVGSPEPLIGMVSFQRVNSEKPVEGRFSLTSEAGERFRGRFIARWGTQLAVCG